MEGLNIITKSLFDIELKEVEMSKNERWTLEEIYKYELIHKTKGLLGILYLDPFPRNGKYDQAANCTLRCGCELEDGSYQIPRVFLYINRH